LELFAGPEDRPLRADVEPVRIEHRPLIVVAQKRDLATLHHPVNALPWIRAITDDVAQTVGLSDPLGLDVLQHHLQGFEVPVNIADQSTAHREGPPTGSKHRGESNGKPHARRLTISLE